MFPLSEEALIRLFVAQLTPGVLWGPPAGLLCHGGNQGSSLCWEGGMEVSS